MSVIVSINDLRYKRFIKEPKETQTLCAQQTSSKAQQYRFGLLRFSVLNNHVLAYTVIYQHEDVDAFRLAHEFANGGE